MRSSSFFMQLGHIAGPCSGILTLHLVHFFIDIPFLLIELDVLDLNQVWKEVVDSGCQTTTSFIPSLCFWLGNSTASPARSHRADIQRALAQGW